MRRKRMLTLTVFGSVVMAWALACEANAGTAEPPKPADCDAGAKCCAEKSKCCPADAKTKCCLADAGAKCSADKGAGCSANAGKGCSAVKGTNRPCPPVKQASRGGSPEVAKVVERLRKIGYSDQDIAGLPTSVTCASAGCSNPVAFAKLKEGDTVVDLGCGAGIDCFLAAKQVGNDGKVIGVDMSPERIAAAEENKRKIGAENVEFRKGRLEKMPVEDESVDVAISNCVGCVMRGDAAVLAEAFRVLRPGGRLVVAAGPELDPMLRAVGFEAVRSGKMVTATKPTAANAGS